jgi:hypothetical protein
MSSIGIDTLTSGSHEASPGEASNDAAAAIALHRVAKRSKRRVSVLNAIAGIASRVQR